MSWSTVLDPTSKTYGIVRHVINGIGGLLVGVGIATQGDVSTFLGGWEDIAGIVSMLFATGWSIWAKVKGIPVDTTPVNTDSTT